MLRAVSPRAQHTNAPNLLVAVCAVDTITAGGVPSLTVCAGGQCPVVLALTLTLRCLRNLCGMVVAVRGDVAGVVETGFLLVLLVALVTRRRRLPIVLTSANASRRVARHHRIEGTGAVATALIDVAQNAQAVLPEILLGTLVATGPSVPRVTGTQAARLRVTQANTAVSAAMRHRRAHFSAQRHDAERLRALCPLALRESRGGRVEALGTLTVGLLCIRCRTLRTLGTSPRELTTTLTNATISVGHPSTVAVAVLVRADDVTLRVRHTAAGARLARRHNVVGGAGLAVVSAPLSLVRVARAQARQAVGVRRHRARLAVAVSHERALPAARHLAGVVEDLHVALDAGVAVGRVLVRVVALLAGSSSPEVAARARARLRVDGPVLRHADGVAVAVVSDAAAAAHSLVRARRARRTVVSRGALRAVRSLEVVVARARAHEAVRLRHTVAAAVRDAVARLNAVVVVVVRRRRDALAAVLLLRHLVGLDRERRHARTALLRGVEVAEAGASAHVV
eukprot:Rhum_TRINITY_DN15197_c0_g1::Rhum_TRINITY_DN15197_c0_g1_i3::g.142648::m.142648